MGHGRFLRMWFNIVSSPPRSSQAITMLSSPPPFGCYFPLHCQSAVLLSETTTASAKNLAGPHPFLSYVLLPVSCFCVSCHIYCSLIFSSFHFGNLILYFLIFHFHVPTKPFFFILRTTLSLCFSLCYLSYFSPTLNGLPPKPSNQAFPNIPIEPLSNTASSHTFFSLSLSLYPLVNRASLHAPLRGFESRVVSLIAVVEIRDKRRRNKMLKLKRNTNSSFFLFLLV